MEDRLLRNQAECCAPHIGAAEELHEAVGVPVYVYYEPRRSPYERTVAAVRSWLDDAAWKGPEAFAHSAGRESAA
jgi:glutamate formiminotransferase